LQQRQVDRSCAKLSSLTRKLVLAVQSHGIIISEMPPIQPQGYQPQQMPQQTQVPQYQSANSSRPHSKTLLIVTILLGVLLLAVLIFALWAFNERNTYKDKTDQIVAKEVTAAKQQTSDEKDKEFLEKEKSPLKEYKGPATYGSVSIMYPKTWSAYVNQSGDSGQPVNGYFHPNFVPAVDSGTAFALRVEVISKSYEQVVKEFDTKVKSGKVKVSPYQAPKVPAIAGSRVEGEINQGQKGIMVLFPLRDKTLKISTQTDSFQKDFNEIILANLTFSP
jgi:hypothetical protein